MVGGGHDYNFWFFFGQHFPEIAIGFGLISGQFGQFGLRFGELVLVYITQGHNLRLTGLHGASKYIHAPPARTHQGGFVGSCSFQSR